MNKLPVGIVIIEKYPKDPTVFKIGCISYPKKNTGFSIPVSFPSKNEITILDHISIHGAKVHVSRTP